MPTASGFPLWLTRTLRALTWLTLALGLSLGAAWALLHVWIVPRIADFRPALEQAATQAVGLPVRIGQVRAESTGWVPSFELSDIRLLDAQGRTALNLPRVVLAISLRSLFNQGLEQLVLDRPELDIRRTASGQWLVAGMDLGGGHNSIHTHAADWLFAQREVVVRGGALRWHNEGMAPQAPAQDPLVLQDVDIVLRNGARHHDWRVDATPPARWGERFVLMGRFRRALLSLHPGRFSDWSGQTYAWLPQVDVAEMRQHLPLNVGLSSGLGRLRLWSDFQKGQWRSGTADMDLQQVQLQLDAALPALALPALHGRISGSQDATGWTAQTQQLAFTTASGLHWPGGHVRLQQTHARVGRAAQGSLEADQLNLQALREVALHLPLPETWLTPLSEHQLSGRVQTLALQWQGEIREAHAWRGQLQASALHLEPAGPTGLAPGLQGAELQLRFEPEAGQARLNMPHGGWLSWPAAFEEPRIAVQQLQADVRWQLKNGLWHLPQWHVQLRNEDLQGQAQGRWHAKTGSAHGVLDLQAGVTRARAERLHRYLPLSLPADVRHYVRDSVRSGQLRDLQIRVHGDLDKLPMRNARDGDWRFAGQLQDVTLDYLPASLMPPGRPPWPALQGLRGLLVFEREGMQLRAASARLGDEHQPVFASKLQADIPDLAHDPQLQVQAELKAAAPQLLRVLQQSPLDGMLSGALSSASASGMLQGPLRLDIPLLHPDDTRVRGQILMSGNTLQMRPDVPALERLSGAVAYTESGLRLQDVRAMLLGGMARIEGGLTPPQPSQPGQPGQPPQMLFRAQGQIAAQALRDALPWPSLAPLAQRLQGQTDYSASLGWRQGRPELEVQSTLQGLALDFPAPLTKAAATVMPLLLRTTQQPSGPAREWLQLQLGDVAAANYERDLSGPEPVVLRGALGLGRGALPLAGGPAQGVSARLQAGDLSLDAWQALWPNKASDSATPLGPWLDYLPQRLSVQADSLTAHGRTLHQVVAGITRQANTWSGNIDARELNGHLQYLPPMGNTPGQLQARLARLDLPPSSIPDVEALLETPPSSIPSLDIRIENLGLRGHKLGQVDIEAVNHTSGSGREWLLRKFNLSVPEATLRASGRWAAPNAQQARRTELDFRLDLEDAGSLLTRLDMPGVLRAGQGQLSGHLGWEGSPMGLHYPSLQGQMQIDVRQGQFLQADPGVAKLLGVLSLQGLPRRLLLDFRDVFAQGFAFDLVQGDAQIRQGIAATNNLQIKGINALVKMEGTANLAQETQQLQVLIQPQLDAGGASVVAGLAINPVVGLTSYLAQWLLQLPLSRAAVQAFTIDGSWSAPRVTRVDPSTGAQP